MKLSLLLLPIALLLQSCSGSSSSSSTGSSAITSWDDTFANGFAVASPLSTTSSKKILNSTLTGDETVQEKVELLDSIATGTAVSGCSIQFPSLNGFSGNATCYGPAVNYSNHPDGGGGSAQLPTGDLGLWEATQSGEACAAAQMNTLMSKVSVYIDTALMVQASMVCLLNENSVGFSATADITDELQTSLQVSNPTSTVSSATVSNSGSVSTYEIAGTLDGVKGFDLTIKIKKISDTNYQGKIYGYFTTANVDAFSASFVKNGNDLSVKLAAGSWLAASIDSIFNGDGELNQDDSFNGNMNQALISMNNETGEGNISYAWQAGSGDDKTRVFNAYVTDTAGTLSGCGYFGYGDDFNENLSLNTNTIEGFICNWAGPGNDHSMSTASGKTQKQCFTENAGVMEEVTAKRAITYAPTVSCNDTDGAFTYDWPAHSGDAAVNDLITLLSDTDFENYSAPTAPTLDSDL